jgi:ABC-type sugar transport system ATPase subunit
MNRDTVWDGSTVRPCGNGRSVLLSRLDDRIDPLARVQSLSIAEQQVVEIARALRHDARVLGDG